MNVDELITKFILSDGDYQSGSKRVLAATDSMIERISVLQRVAGTLGDWFSRLFSPLALLAGIGGVTGLGALAVAAVKADADLSALRMGLTAVIGDADKAAQAFSQLRQVAKLPGLSLPEAIKGYEGFYVVLEDGNAAIRILREFGNALAMVGGGREEIGNVITDLTRVISAGKLYGNELRQISAQVPQFRKALKELYGTTDPEVLHGMDSRKLIMDVTGWMEQNLQRMGNSPKNSLINLGNSLQIAFAAAGHAINQFLVPALDKVASFLDYIVEGGLIDRIAEGFSKLGSFDLGDTLVSAISFVLAAIQQMPKWFIFIRQFAVNAFEVINDHARNFAAILGMIFLGGTIVSGVKAFITTLMALKDAWTAVAIAEAMAEAFVNIAALVAGLAAGAFAGKAIYDYMAGMTGTMGKKIGKSPIISDLWADYNDIRKGFASSQSGNPIKDMLGNSIPILQAALDSKQQTALLGKIAGNTEKQLNLDMRRYALGGGDLGRLGVTATEHGRLGKASDIGHATTTGGFGKMGKLLEDLVNEAFYEGIRQGNASGLT